MNGDTTPRSICVTLKPAVDTKRIREPFRVDPVENWLNFIGFVGDQALIRCMRPKEMPNNA